MPARTSPLPAVAMPLFPVLLKKIPPSGSAVTVRASLRTHVAPVSILISRADVTRSFLISAALFPVRRAISPMCGVSVTLPEGVLVRTLRSPSSTLSPSASSTTGFSHTARSSWTSRDASSLRPIPGPHTTASHQSSARCSSVSIFPRLSHVASIASGSDL